MQNITKLTLERASKEFGVSKETLRRGLQAIGEDTGKGLKYDLATLWRALGGDLRSAKAREVRARAGLLEMERDEKEGRLIDVNEHDAWCNQVLQPIRQWMLSLPATLANRVNPSDPAFAQHQIQSHVDDALPMLREKIRELARK